MHSDLSPNFATSSYPLAHTDRYRSNLGVAMRIRPGIAIVVALAALAAAFLAGTALRVSGEGRNGALPRASEGTPERSSCARLARQRSKCGRRPD